MYEDFTIENFRSFSSLQLNDLASVNLIAGKNNVGKTALLEALFIHAGMWNPELVLRINSFRGIDLVVDLSPNSAPPWDNLFNNFNLDLPITLSARINNIDYIISISSLLSNSNTLYQANEPSKHASSLIDSPSYASVSSSDVVSYRPKMVLELKTEIKGALDSDARSGVGAYRLLVDGSGVRVDPQPPQPRFITIFLGPKLRSLQDAERYTKLVIDSKEQVLLDALRKIEPRLRRLELLQLGNKLTLFGELKGVRKLVPLPLMGEGISYAASLALSITAAKNGVVLVDEVENGIHYSALEGFWATISDIASKFNVQVFATTHSLECIQAANKVFLEANSTRNFALYRLERVISRGEGPTSVRAVRFDEKELEVAIKQGWEVR